MNFLSSIFFGSPERYFINKHYIEFIKDPYVKVDLPAWSRIFNCCSQRYLRIFLGTITKAFMCKLLTGEETKRNVCAIDTGVGYMTYPSKFVEGAEWKKTVVYCSTIMSTINLLGIEIIAAKVISNYVSWPVTMLIASGVSLSIFDCLYQRGPPTLGERENELTLLARNKTQLGLATAILSAQIALGVTIISKM